MAVEVRLASPDEYAVAGQLTLDAYVGDGFLEHDDDYATQVGDAARRAREAELFVAVDAAAGSGAAEVVGTVTYCPPGSSWRELGGESAGEFRMLAVAPAQRGRGIGRLLVQHCIDRTHALGLDGVVICSLPSMTAAHVLYATMGFRRAPELDWEPAPGVVLWAFAWPGST